jgi:hypothetical protein
VLRLTGIACFIDFLRKTGEPWRARTSDPLIKSALKHTPAGYGSYDLLTFTTGCSRQRVHLLLPVNASLWVFWSQVGHKPIPCLAWNLFIHHVHEYRIKAWSDDHCGIKGFQVRVEATYLMLLNVTK